MKLLIIGYGRHGKDCVAQMIVNETKMTSTSSSLFAAKEVVYPEMKDEYVSVEECFQDRHNHRKRWYDLICEFNRNDPTSLSKAIFKEHDIYVGLRAKVELDAVKSAGMVDKVIWVDASQRLPAEGKDSCTVTKSDADFVLDNNGTLSDLRQNVCHMLLCLGLIV